MAPERWRQVEDLFNAALEREPAARPVFLENACGGDEALQQQVEALLHLNGQDGELLSQPIAKVVDELLIRSDPEASLSPGFMAGPYRIGVQLGAGGMGEVYRAHDTRLNRTVAIKTLKAPFSERFEREARAVSALNHPHICTLYDIGSQDGIAYLVMEYVEGEPLEGPLGIAEALRLAIQIASAIAAAHEKRILHRDLKPGNILVSKCGVKLLDFGLAKFVPAGSRSAEVTETSPLTGAGQILGTLAYMAPEQLEGKPADTRSDIFSFGLVLYEMLTGRRAFQSSSRAGLMASILKEEPPPLTTLLPSIPAALERTVRKCLVKEPERRWQAASDLRDELAWIAESESAVPRDLPRRAFLPWIAGAAAAGLGIGGLANRFWRGKNSAVPAAATRLRLTAPEGTRLQYVMHLQSMSVSPVEGRVAMIAVGAQNQMVWVQRLDSLTARPLAGTEGARIVFWSPNGQFIGFWANGKLKKISAEGGTPLPICDIPEPWSANWNKDGVIVVVAGPGPTWIVDANSGASTRWKPVLFPKYLPDGKHVLYLSMDPKIGSYRAYVEEFSTGRQTALMPTDTHVVFAPDQPGSGQGYIIFGRASTLLAQRFDANELRAFGESVPVAQDVPFFQRSGWSAFDASPGVLIQSAGSPKCQLIRVDRFGRRLGNQGDPQHFWEWFRLSPDGKKLVFDVFDADKGSTDIWLYDLAKNTAERVTSEPGLEVHPVWSPDGSRIAFGSGQGGLMPQLKVKALGEAGIGQGFPAGEYQEPSDWSPDGRWISYQTWNDEIWLASPADRTLIPLLQTRFSIQHAVFSPDRRHLAFATNENGPYEIYVQRFEAGDSPKVVGPRLRVSHSGGVKPKWRGDGKELFFLSPDRQIMAVEVQQGTEIGFGPPAALFVLPPSSPSPFEGETFDVSANGQSFLVLIREAAGAPLEVVVNWQAGLKG